MELHREVPVGVANLGGRCPRMHAEHSVVVRLGARIRWRLIAWRVVLLLVLFVVLAGDWLARRNRLLPDITR